MAKKIVDTLIGTIPTVVIAGTTLRLLDVAIPKKRKARKKLKKVI